MEKLLISGNTNPGLRRKQNQDAWSSKALWAAEKALLVVVDGVGGYTGGEKAAAIAKEAIEQYMQMPSGDTLTMLREAVVFANNRIVEERKKDQQNGEMCCVLTTVVADAVGGKLYYVHVGDTRLYRYRAGKLQKLTKDHSFVGIREDAGELSELEAMNHPQRNQIFREVGSAQHRLDDEDFLEYGTEELLPGDTLLLCSDGLTDMVTTQQISTLLSTGQPITNKVNNLINLANEMGGYDNITVLLLHYPQATGSQIEENEPPAFVAVKEEMALAGAGDPEATTKMASRNTATVNTAKQGKKPSKTTLLWAAAVACLLLIALPFLFFAPPMSSALPAPEHITVTPANTAEHPDSNAAIPIRRSTHPAVPGPLTEERRDTLRITSPQSYESIKHYVDSTGKTIVLMPAKTAHTNFAAIEISTRSAKPGDTLELKNIRFNNFETGIHVQVPVMLRTENLVFENTKYPFRYPLKADSRNAAVLFMNKSMR